MFANKVGIEAEAWWGTRMREEAQSKVQGLDRNVKSPRRK